MKVLILVNLDANDKKAEQKWEVISDDIVGCISGSTEIVRFHVPFDMAACIHDKIVKKGIKYIISAGGDGTANIILNALYNEIEIDMSEITLGFIGLGSSNDLLKPVSRMIKNVPIKIGINNAKPVDLGLASFLGIDQIRKNRIFLGNSSIGVGAVANWFFNNEGLVIKMLKSRWVNLAILYATLKAIFSFKNYPLHIRYNGTEYSTLISYLAIIKTPHISGKMKFDQKILSNDGKLGLNYCENMNKLDLMLVLKDLQNGIFSGKKKRHSCFVKELFIKSKISIPIEFDGEVLLTDEVRFSVLPKAIRCMY